MSDTSGTGDATDAGPGTDAGDGTAACYRHRTAGQYKTFRPGDIMFKPDWLFIHNGDCECEGKTADECQEPGDNN